MLCRHLFVKMIFLPLRQLQFKCENCLEDILHLDKYCQFIWHFRKLLVSVASESKEVKACFDAFAAEAAKKQQPTAYEK